jgi:hypothetical protein
MELHEFPRPPQDNGRGVHWSLSVYEWGKRNWDFWRDQLLAMKIKWVKIMDDGGGSGLRLARQLIDMEIMPVVRLYRPQQNPGTIGQRGREAVRRYVQAGAMYFETNNEPDLDLEWRIPKPDNWLDLVVQDFIADADIVLEEGGYPAMPAFGVGTQRDPFAKVVERGRRDILDGGAWAAIHNYCLARPLEYPNDPVNLQGVALTPQQWEAAGGMWAWEMSVDDVNRARQEKANPNASITTDSTCFRGFEYLNALIVQAVGHSIPIMMTEGGYNVGQRAGTTYGDDPRYAKPTPQAASEMNLEMFRYLQGDRAISGKQVPDYFFAVMPWLIAAYRIGVWAAPAENQGPWFTHQYDEQFGLHGELPLVQMLKDLPSRARQDGPVPQQWIKPPYHQELGHNWDCRLKYLGVGLETVPTTSDSYWKLVKTQWFDEDEISGAGGYIYVKALDEADNSLDNVTFIVARPDASDQVPTKGAIDGYWGNYAMYAALGTYKVRMSQGDYPSETVTGMGLGLEDAHQLWARTAFRLTFQLVKPQTPSGGGPTEAERLEALRRGALEAARPRIIPLDANTPFHQYARQHDLGERLSTEFAFAHEGAQYKAQAFVKGVVYAPASAPNQIDFVPYA